jgi:hypothetical protein
VHKKLVIYGRLWFLTYMKMAKLGLAAGLILAFGMLAFAQDPDLGNQNPGTVRRERAAPAFRAAPRRTDGRVSLGPAPGEAGVWLPGPGGNPGEPWPPRSMEVPFQPWTRELFAYRRMNQFEPHTRCKPSGGPRQFLTPYGVEFVELNDLQRIFIMDIGGPHTFRTIYVDGRAHPKNLDPSYYGHSVGHWEGDTLVVDTVGFNEGFWFSRGIPHTDRLHMIERFTRTDYNTTKYEVTIDDPGAYTAAWTAGFQLRFDQGQELFEYVCQDNNFAPELMLGSQESMDRSRLIVP